MNAIAWPASTGEVFEVSDADTFGSLSPADVASVTSTLSKIRAELNRKLRADDAVGISRRRDRLRELFASVPPTYATRLADRLRTRRRDDPLSRLFHDRLHPATMKEMTRVLERVAGGTPDATILADFKSKEHFRDGKTQLGRKEYSEALYRWELGRQLPNLSPANRSVFLYDIGWVNLKHLRRPEIALLYFERILADPGSRADSREAAQKLREDCLRQLRPAPTTLDEARVIFEQAIVAHQAKRWDEAIRGNERVRRFSGFTTDQQAAMVWNMATACELGKRSTTAIFLYETFRNTPGVSAADVRNADARIAKLKANLRMP